MIRPSGKSGLHSLDGWHLHKYFFWNVYVCAWWLDFNSTHLIAKKALLLPQFEALKVNQSNLQEKISRTPCWLGSHLLNAEGHTTPLSHKHEDHYPIHTILLDLHELCLLFVVV